MKSKAGVRKSLLTSLQSVVANAYFEYTFFYKKLGSGHSTKSFLISHEILSILVLKFLNWFLIL